MGWVNVAHPPDRTGAEETEKGDSAIGVPFFCLYKQVRLQFKLPLHSLQWNKRYLVKTDCLPLGNRYCM